MGSLGANGMQGPHFVPLTFNENGALDKAYVAESLIFVLFKK